MKHTTSIRTGALYYIPETIDEAESLLVRKESGVTALAYLLSQVGDNEKAFRLYMAHRLALDAAIASRRGR